MNSAQTSDPTSPARSVQAPVRIQFVAVSRRAVLALYCTPSLWCRGTLSITVVPQIRRIRRNAYHSTAIDAPGVTWDISRIPVTSSTPMSGTTTNPMRRV